VPGILQPAVPNPAPRPAQMPERRLVGLGHAVDIGGDLDADRPVVSRLVAGDLDPKGLVRHRVSLSPSGSGAVDVERRQYRQIRPVLAVRYGVRTFSHHRVLAHAPSRW